MKHDLPACPFMDCRSNARGFCEVLTDARFGQRGCPFYRTDEQFKEDYERTIYNGVPYRPRKPTKMIIKTERRKT